MHSTNLYDSFPFIKNTFILSEITIYSFVSQFGTFSINLPFNVKNIEIPFSQFPLISIITQKMFLIILHITESINNFK